MGFIFEAFPKIARYKRELVITEKLDGTNAQVAFFPLDTKDDLAAAHGDPYCMDIFPGAESGDSALAMYVGSLHVPGFPKPEGIVIYHTASRTYYKQTFEMDGGKG